MDTICVICKMSHFIPKGDVCLTCVQKQKHRKDVEEFIESSKKNAPKIHIEANEPFNGVKLNPVILDDGLKPISIDDF